MANPEQIEQELREYVGLEKNLKDEARVQYLMAIFNKHFAIDKIDHTMFYADFAEVVNYAKVSYTQTTMPIEISKKEVYYSEANHVLIIEALISYLNRNKLLKRLIKLDYTRR